MGYIIGLTGGMGCGKSTVSHYLKEKNYLVIDADAIAHQIMEPNEMGFNETVKAFGTTILEGNGRLNRKKLGDLVFNDSTKLKKLNAITHPLIKEKIQEAIRQHNNESIIILDIPLLVENGNYHNLVDEIWVVVASKEQQLQRVMQRDNLSLEQVLSRLDKQCTTEEKSKFADVIIDNSGDLAHTYKQVDFALNAIKLHIIDVH